MTRYALIAAMLVAMSGGRVMAQCVPTTGVGCFHTSNPPVQFTQTPSQSWTAFIVVQGSSSAIPLDWPTEPNAGPLKVTVGEKPDKPMAKLEASNAGDARVDRVIGVQSVTTVMVPASSALVFTTEALCDKAVAALTKAHQVASATCVQT